jgi:molybdopterin/thiamine biosynthesis adenylyltransferase/rhodanese-related sulfurtransferase
MPMATMPTRITRRLTLTLPSKQIAAATLPDYSRQQLLKEIGPQGQELLARSRVLIVGAGGLGSPVLQYLAGAGVGTLGLIDADNLAASNLHRQPIYALADVGRQKVELARAAVQALNPTVRVETFAVRFTAENARALVADYDVTVDCTDNFRAKYLVNDAAVLTQRPAVFASVYQYEGQLQVYKPQHDHACLRCIWPDALADGIVGNCAEAGVLGPIPGAVGSLQALLTLKILLKLAGQLPGELLLLDFTNFSNTKIRARRRTECRAPGCARIQALAGDEADVIEVSLKSLAEAAEQGITVIDIRTTEEFAAHPTAARHLPMADLLANPQLLPRDTPLVLMCASGRRSAAAARELRKHGVNVRSLAGGLALLEH